MLYSEATENPSRSVTSKEWLSDQKANSKERLRADGLTDEASKHLKTDTHLPKLSQKLRRRKYYLLIYESSITLTPKTKKTL